MAVIMLNVRKISRQNKEIPTYVGRLILNAVHHKLLPPPPSKHFAKKIYNHNLHHLKVSCINFHKIIPIFLKFMWKKMLNRLNFPIYLSPAPFPQRFYQQIFSYSQSRGYKWFFDVKVSLKSVHFSWTYELTNSMDY